MFSVGCGIIAEDVDGRLFRLTMRCFADDFRALQKWTKVKIEIQHTMHKRKVALYPYLLIEGPCSR